MLRKFGLTTIIVTHDREEAFELADRVAVLIDGRIQQHAKPQQVYERPANLIVARFMGLNVLPIEMLGDGCAQLSRSRYRLEVACDDNQGPAHIAIVPERTWITHENGAMKNVVPGEVVRTQYRGGEYRLRVRIENPYGGSIIEARSKEMPQGKSVFVHLPIEAIHVISESTLPGKALPVEPSSPHRELGVVTKEIA
jgi:ABC-type Fe3+/spermidine/putrescine transport system ATPase subunit